MTLYRVFYYLPGAAASASGGALFVPPQGPGRVDNPADYAVLYVGDSAAGVCAEVFNRGAYRSAWSSKMLRGLPSIPGSQRALASYDVDDATAICDLDDPKELVTRSLRPSAVVALDYTESRAWSLQIFGEKRWAGVSWWSYHNSAWNSIGLWDQSTIRAHSVRVLTMSDAAIVDAAAALSIPIVP